MKLSKIIALSLSVLLSFSAIFVLSANVSAEASPITSCVNLSNVKKNESGNGYYWDNRNDKLTLSGLNINTTDDCGLKIPENATVELKGTNYITASKIGLVCYGTTVFTGSGSLIITAGETGIYNNSQDYRLYTRITSGTFTITAGDCAVSSPNAGFYLVGGKLELKTTQKDGYAINGRVVKLMGGSITADNSINASYQLQISALSLTIASSRAALSCEGGIKMDTVSIRAGSSLSSLADKNEYSGENCLMTESTAAFWGPSYIFGDSVPVFVDYIVVALLLLAIVAAIAVPTARKKLKAKKVRETVDEYERAHTVERRSDKKSKTKNKKQPDAQN